MTSQAILIDSGCAPTPELISKYNVLRMGMKINLDGEDYIDGEDLDLDSFYGRIDKVRDFSTSPPLVWDIKRLYEEIRRQGYDSLLAIHVSSKMSKLLETCENAKNMVSGLDVQLIDSGSLSIGACLVAEKVIELAQGGRSAVEIRNLLPEIRKSSCLQISLSTLKYLVKNKRIGRVQGMVGSMLKMRPVLGIDQEGFLTTIATERGGNRVIRSITERAVDFLARRPYNVKIYMTWGFDENRLHVDRVWQEFSEEFKKLGIKNHSLIKTRMWPTLACNSGPGAYGFAVYGEEHPIQ